MSKKILIPLAEGCEELEAVTLIDLFRRANLEVITASLKEDTVVLCSRGTRIVADINLQSLVDGQVAEWNTNSIDLIVLPGGLPGADNLNDDPRIHQLLTDSYTKGNYIAAICAAPRVLLSNPDLKLNITKLTCYPGALNHLDTSSVEVSQDDVVQDGRIITSKGPGTAIVFALELIELLLGPSARQEVEAPLLLTNKFVN